MDIFNSPVEEGKIMHATFDLNGKLFMCSDSPPIHDWNFTPAVSNYIDCENESDWCFLAIELKRLPLVRSLNNHFFNNWFFPSYFNPNMIKTI